MKLDVYGRMIEVIWSNDKWKVFYLGPDGKKRLANDLVVPLSIKQNEIVNYFSDLCHEWAEPGT